MDVAKEVRALANWPESGHLVISLYLNTKWSDEQQREKVRIFVKDRLKEMEKELPGGRSRWPAVKDDVDFIREYVDGLVAQEYDVDYDGIAVFCCNHEGLRTVLRSRFPFENEFHLAPRPRIRPLAHLYDEYEAAIFADIGTNDAHIYAISAGEVEQHVLIENEVPGRHKQGGWSQARFGRHIEDRMDRHHREVADQLVRLVYRMEIRNILLSGTEHVVASFRQHLPRGVDEWVIATPRLDRNPSLEKILKTVGEHLWKAERAREEAVVKKVVNLASSPSRVAVGLSPVLHAIAHGRVHRLLLDHDYEKAGFRCQACGKLGEKPDESCELCGEPVITTDLAEAMVVATIQRGGEVDEVLNRAELKELGGVAALLRY